MFTDSLIQKINIRSFLANPYTVFLEHCHKRETTRAGPKYTVLGSEFCSRTEQVLTAIQVPILRIWNIVMHMEKSEL